MQATKSIPIVMVGVANPVELGIVAGFVKPGGNVTGSSFLANEFAGKLLQFLKEAAPRLRSVALFVNPSNEAAAQFVKQYAGGRRGPRDAGADGRSFGQGRFRARVRGHPQREHGIDIASSGTADPIQTRRHRGLRADSRVAAGRRGRQPCLFRQAALIAFGPTRDEYARLAARYVDRILKGAKPGDLSIEQPTRFNLVINLKTAKALGLTIPQTLLLRADEVIQ